MNELKHKEARVVLSHELLSTSRRGPRGCVGVLGQEQFLGLDEVSLRGHVVRHLVGLELERLEDGGIGAYHFCCCAFILSKIV